jgi:hypothetical protein
MNHLPGYEEMYLDKWYLNGSYSGASPISVDVFDTHPMEKVVFMDIFDWVLFNNGLIVTIPINLS